MINKVEMNIFKRITFNHMIDVIGLIMMIGGIIMSFGPDGDSIDWVVYWASGLIMTGVAGNGFAIERLSKKNARFELIEEGE
jgi:hypothetical protein